MFIVIIRVDGCGRHLVYVHNSSIGVDVNISAKSRTAKLTLGYDRERFADILKHETGKKDNKHVEAMSRISISNVDDTDLGELSFHHMIATGHTAKNVAKDEEGLKAMRNAVFGETGE